MSAAPGWRGTDGARSGGEEDGMTRHLSPAVSLFTHTPRAYAHETCSVAALRRANKAPATTFASVLSGFEPRSAASRRHVDAPRTAFVFNKKAETDLHLN